jgi:DTW domain-containing protein YfiP
MKRKTCENCLRPASVCYCSEIQFQDNAIKVIILQHPDEFAHPLGTAKMANLTFLNSHKLIGINFDNNSELQNLLKEKRAVILYPSDDAKVCSKNHKEEKIEILIVLDGTWRKAKRIYEESSILHSLEKIKLPDGQESKYQIRKAPKVNYLSTFESITYALNILEESNYSTSLQVLESQVKKHIELMGNKFDKFYNKN